MQNSTLLVLLYVLIILIVWLADLRIYKKELFVNSSNGIGLAVFFCGIFWPLWIWILFMVNCEPLMVKLLKKMNDIKF
ncbi:MAG: hypothetical protein ACI9N9_002603 [Enterobacterales bacterium]|jgi:hypothetical protein